MNTINLIEVIVYSATNGKQPFVEWFNKLDKKAKSIILERIARVRKSNFGDCKSIKGSSIWELRLYYGPGYRIYFGKKGTQIVLLLTGGDKGSQTKDIAKAKQYWLDYTGKTK